MLQQLADKQANSTTQPAEHSNRLIGHPIAPNEAAADICPRFVKARRSLRANRPRNHVPNSVFPANRGRLASLQDGAEPNNRVEIY